MTPNQLDHLYETLRTACEYLDNGTPIRNGSDLHADLVAARDMIDEIASASPSGKRCEACGAMPGQNHDCGKSR
jgi:hypothetical protein